MLRLRSIGLESFQKEILFEGKSPEEMFEKERELVEVGPHSYNLKEGGSGGWDYVNRAGLYKNKSKETMRYAGLRSKILKRGIHDPEKRNNETSQMQTLEAKEKRRVSLQRIKHQQGSKNSQFGTKWITDGESSRKIKRDEAIPEGWKKGRK
mgnify:CR=1 FL=1